MNENKICYRDGYKYQLVNTWTCKTPITGFDAKTPEDLWASLAPDGTLTIKATYAWDGPSGPTFDTPNFMRGSLAHDALYQLMREGALPQSCREAADNLLHDLCRQDGMGFLRAWYVRKAVREFAAGAAARQATRVKFAP